MRTFNIDKRERRSGFTLIEVSVVISIIGILSSLLLVAVQSSREAARRTECLNHNRQLVLAVQQFESNNGYLPEVDRRITLTRGLSQTEVLTTSGYISLLPFLELPALAAKVKDSSPRDYENLWEGHVLLTKVPVFLCPSDTQSIGVNYRFSTGTTAFTYEYDGMIFDGAFGHNARTIAEITSGLSNTAAFSERKIGSPGSFDGSADIWTTQLYPTFRDDELTPTFFRQLATELEAHPPSQFFPYAGKQWHNPGKMNVMYDHVFVPNRTVSGIVHGPNSSTSPSRTGAVGASSRHSGGVHVSRLDGSVSFIADQVDRKVWSALGSARLR